MSATPVVFIHGMYMTGLCWEHWLARFESSGRSCSAPNWPGRDLPVDEQRKLHPDQTLGALTLRKVVEHLSKIVAGISPKPVAIGHSMGGLVVQLLLQKDLVSAGVAIDSAPPAGVLAASWSFLKSNWPHITPFKPIDQPIEMTFPRFQYTFVNGLPREEQQTAYRRYVVPESRRVPRESLGARVDFKKQRPPLLLVGGSSDHIVPAKVTRRNYAKYRGNKSSATDYEEFPGRTHFIIGQTNWEEVADKVMAWITEKGL